MRLAAALDVSQAALKAYLEGKEAVPQRAFLTALDIVAGKKPGMP